MNGWDCTNGTCKCRYCSEVKPCAEFYPAPSPRGHSLRCRACTTQAVLASYAETHPNHAPRVQRMAPCPWCGTSFRRTYDRDTYCSYACAYAARRKPDASRVYFSVCLHCQRPFASRRSGRKYCSRECSWRYGYPETLVKPRPATCLDCGATYTQSNGHNVRCPPCVEARRDALRHVSKALRRTRQQLNGPTEAISRRAIYERDRWTCYLCGRRVKRGAEANDPLAPTLDHVMPLALGGTHTADNLRLACRACNLAKGATFLVPPPMKAKRGR